MEIMHTSVTTKSVLDQFKSCHIQEIVMFENTVGQMGFHKDTRRLEKALVNIQIHIQTDLKKLKTGDILKTFIKNHSCLQ